MTARRLILLASIAALLMPAMATAAPAPSLLAGPCVAGGSYDPACDVDHNGVIDVLDIQLAAGHWNQSGAFTSGSWDLAGNAGTTPGADFLGTVDNQALEVKVNGQRALRIELGVLPNLVGGYSGNYVSSGVIGAVIAGGGKVEGVNRVTDNYGFVGGGEQNQAGNNNGILTDAGWGAVSGGWFNTAGNYAVVGGGGLNTASGLNSTVAGGYRNDATGGNSTVGGGGNTASGSYATVPGGAANTAAGNYSFAAGFRAKANNTGAFVLADSRDFDFAPVTDNAFTARFTGGARFILGINGTGATTWLCAVYNGGSWGCSSDRNVKENFQPVDGRAILEQLATLPITTWNAIGTDPDVRRMGPMAQDFYAAFGLGDDDKVITTGDLDGVALASIQGLHQIVQEQDTHITDLEARLAALEAVVQQLQTERSGQ